MFQGAQPANPCCCTLSEWQPTKAMLKLTEDTEQQCLVGDAHHVKLFFFSTLVLVVFFPYQGLICVNH